MRYGRRVKVVRNSRSRTATFDNGVVLRVDNRDIGERRGDAVLPTSWRATVRSGSLAYDLDLDIQADEAGVHCISVKASQRDGGAPVTVRGLRSLKIDSYLRHSAQLVARKAPVEFAEGMFVIRPLTLREREELDAKVANRGGRRVRESISDDRLSEVVAAWRRYAGTPNALTTAARSVNLSRSHFHRMREAAIERGLLDEAEVPRRNRGDIR